MIVTIVTGLGFLLMILGVTDFVTARFLGREFTRVWWSPLALGGVGLILIEWNERALKVLFYPFLIFVTIVLVVHFGLPGVDTVHAFLRMPIGSIIRGMLSALISWG